MTALEFARENLFSPLDIRNVYWPADPQGVTHGWGDLALHPRDMAKFGVLFLHQGQWGGRQIVSRQWVNSAVAAHMQGTGKIEDYGYGWWVSPKSLELAYFIATGSGGQKIRVVPSMHLILVTTGGGVEPEEIEPYLATAMIDLEKPLPLNPTGVADLNAALADIAQSPEPEPVSVMPATANAISGKTYIFGADGESTLGLLSLRLDFDNTSEAIFQLEVANEPSPRLNGVGLDGVYRSSHAGRPIVARGRWTDARTFVIDYNEGPGFVAYSFRLSFDGNMVTFEIPGLGSYEAEQE